MYVCMYVRFLNTILRGIEHFGQTNWEKLTENERKQHSLANCKACDVHHFSYQSLFPLWGNKTNTITHEGIYNQMNSRILKQSSAGNNR